MNHGSVSTRLPLSASCHSLFSSRHVPSGTCRRTFAIIACFNAIVEIPSGAVAFAAEVQVIRIDGTKLSGSWGGSLDGNTIVLAGPNERRILPLDDLESITFLRHRFPNRVGWPVSLEMRKTIREKRQSGQPSQGAASLESFREVGNGFLDPPGAAVFHLADGGRLLGTLLDPPSSADAVMGKTALGDSVELPFDRLSGVQLASREQFPRAEKLFRSALAARLPGQDVLITRGLTEPRASARADTAPEPGDSARADQERTPGGTADPKSLRGRLESLGPEGGTFVFSDRSRTFRAQRVFGIVFAAGAASPKRDRDPRRDHKGAGKDTSTIDQPGYPQRYPVTFALTDGSVFSGRIERADTESIRIATSFGSIADVRLTEVVNLRIDSERVVYISDLKTAGERTTGILHRPWPARFDLSVSGGPLLLGGRTYTKGLGVHSRTELVFDIEGEFEMLVATIGIDDSVRPRGDVVFRVLGDDKMLFESGAVKGTDAPQDIKVDVANVRVLTLIVDYGGQLDLADHADWANARLLKPAAGTDAPTH